MKKNENTRSKRKGLNRFVLILCVLIAAMAIAIALLVPKDRGTEKASALSTPSPIAAEPTIAPSPTATPEPTAAPEPVVWESNPVSDFEYEISSGEVSITRYVGDDKTVVIPREIRGLTVTGIDGLGFWNSEIEALKIPDSVTNINAVWLISAPIEVEEGNPNYAAKDGVLYDADFSCLIHYPSQKEDSSYQIPSTVTAIGEGAFQSCYNLTEIIIPDSVKSIGANAFSACQSLTSVSIGDGVTEIGEYAFVHCASLASVNMGKRLSLIGNYAFAGCIGLESIVLPDSLTSIGDFAFNYCSALRQISIPAGTTSLGECIFNECEALTSINVSHDNPNFTSLDGMLYSKNFSSLLRYPPAKEGTDYTVFEGTARIGRSAFLDCTIIERIILPESLTDIGAYAFYSCTSLCEITLPKDLVAIGESAFSGCTELKEITIPEKVTEIKNFTFSDCSSLEMVTLSDVLVSVDGGAFESCSSLKTIRLPKTLTYFAPSALDNCNALSFVEVDAENPNYASVDGVLFDKGISSLIKYPAQKDGAFYKVPDSVTSIVGYAFAFCKLTEVILPEGLGGLEDGVFMCCTELMKVNIPSGVTKIGGSAFTSCEKLTEITLPDSVEAIYYYAFYGCTSLTRIGLPKGVASVDGSAFSGCTALTSFEVDGDNQNFASVDGVLFDKGCSKLIKFPASKPEKSYTIPDTVTEIGYWAFSDCSMLEKIIISEGAETIGYWTFDGCSQLSSIEVAADNPNFASADGVLFSKDFRLLIKYPAAKEGSSFTIPDGVKEIDEGAFAGCSRLATVTIPASVTTIFSAAFSDCSGLTRAIFEGAPPYLFGGCFDAQVTLLYPSELADLWEAVRVNNRKIPNG